MTRSASGNEKLVQLLLRRKADVLAKNKQDKTPLDLATGPIRTLLQDALSSRAAADEEGGDAMDVEPASKKTRVDDEQKGHGTGRT
jgi:ankyrin repeat protein